MDSANGRRRSYVTSSFTGWTCTQEGPWIDRYIPDSKVHVASMGPTWVLSVPGGFHPGPVNLPIRDGYIGRYQTKPKRKKAGTMCIFLVMHCIVNRLLIRMYCAFRPCRLPAILLIETEVWLYGIVYCTTRTRCRLLILYTLRGTLEWNVICTKDLEAHSMEILLKSMSSYFLEISIEILIILYVT